MTFVQSCDFFLLMNTLIFFCLIMAWIVALWFTLLAITAFIGKIAYDKDKLLQSIDQLRGLRRIYPIAKRFFIALVAWVFLFSYYYTH